MHLIPYKFCNRREFARTMILKFEKRICHTLKWTFSVATIATFLPRYCAASLADSDFILLAECMCDRILLEYGMLSFTPSMIAASIIWLCRVAMKKKKEMVLKIKNCNCKQLISGNDSFGWNSTLCKVTGYKEIQLATCITWIQDNLSKEKASIQQQEILQFEIIEMDKIMDFIVNDSLKTTVIIYQIPECSQNKRRKTAQSTKSKEVARDQCEEMNKDLICKAVARKYKNGPYTLMTGCSL